MSAWHSIVSNDQAVQTAIVGSYETKLELSCTDRDSDGTPTAILAALRGPGLSVSVNAYDDRFGDLAQFFQALADSWRGWPGERTFSSLEGEFELTARHDGHVRLGVRLGRMDGQGPWTVNAEVMVDPGEDIASAARDVRALMEPSPTA